MRRSGSGMKGGDLLARVLLYLVSGQVVECDVKSMTTNGLGRIVSWENEENGRLLQSVQADMVAATVLVDIAMPAMKEQELTVC